MGLCVSSRPLSTRSSSSLLMNLMMSEENNRDIYITILSMPPTVPCSKCCPVPTSMTVPTGGKTKHSSRSGCLVARNPFPPDGFCIFFPTGNRECLDHGYVLHSRYQVVYPFPTFQPAFQLKKDQVILLNTSYSLVACGISLCPGSTSTDTRVLLWTRFSSPQSI